MEAQQERNKKKTAGRIVKIVLKILLIIVLISAIAVAGIHFFRPHVTEKADYADVTVATVPVSDGGTKDLNMDVFLPSSGEGPYPLLIIVHGGQWDYGSYKLPYQRTGLLYSRYGEEFTDLFDLLESGVAIATADYRFSSEAVFPAQIYDIKAYIRYLRAHAEEYNVDPNRIAIFGVSAGAQLAALCAVTNGETNFEGTVGDCLDVSSDVSGCVDYYGMTDFTTLAADLYARTDITTAEDVYELVDAPDSSRSRMLGLTDMGLGAVTADPGKYPEEYELVKMASPYFHIDGNEPPFFIAQGGKDVRVAQAQAEKFYKKLISSGVEATLMINPGTGHEDPGEEINSKMQQFVLSLFGIT